MYIGPLKNGGSTPTIWILNPYQLNEKIGTGRKLADLHRMFKKDYTEFLELENKPTGATACAGDYSVARIRHQRGNFTAHGDLHSPLELFAPETLSKHVLPTDAVDEAREFLELSGVNEFQIFPDLDGLARYVCGFELGI